MSLNSIKNLIDNFLFAPASPYPVAAFRIFFGLMILQNALLLLPDIILWYGKDGIFLDRTNTVLEPFVSLNILNLIPGDNNWLIAVFTIYIIASITLTIGYKSRISSIIVWLVFVSLYHRNCYLLNSGDTFIRVIAFWLMFAPTGAAWSLDHFLRQKKHGAKFNELVPNWGLRCLQMQFCFVYYHAVVTKAPGWPWVYGTAVYISSRLEGLARFPLFISPEIFAISKLISWATLLIEFALFTFIWIKELRYYVMALAICMHLTIDWSMNIPQFEWMMVGTMLLFVYPKDFAKLEEAITSRLHHTNASERARLQSQD